MGVKKILYKFRERGKSQINQNIAGFVEKLRDTEEKDDFVNIL